MNRITDWIVDWLVENCEQNREEIINHLDENYFLNGYIDSFQFINLISEAEDEFDIEFDNDQFEDRSFSTVNGLSAIIERVIENE